MKLIINHARGLFVLFLFATTTAGCGGGTSEGTAEATGSTGGTTTTTTTTAASTGSGDFNLVFEQSFQSCADCGIWFDSAELVIQHSAGTFTARQSGSLLIKQAPYFQGTFRADISAIPASATIQSATLNMLLNREEGISNDDFTSTVSVFGFINGALIYIREITARDDIKGRGFSKANPNVPIDFTDYARQIK